MRRREFISLIGGATAWPVVARAQSMRPVVGFLASGTSKSFAPNVAGFLAGLKEAGFIDGQTLTIEYRWANGQFDRLSGMAAELVKRPVNVLAALQGNASALAAKRATSTIPIIFVTVDDPVATGLVASLNRPGGNLTGVSRLGTSLIAKNLELMHQLLPAVSVIGLLVNPQRPTAELQRKTARNAAATVGKTIRILHARSESEINSAFGTLVQEGIGGLLVPFDPLFNNHRKQILALAAQHAVPTSYSLREFVADGGLMSYGDNGPEAYKLAGEFVARVLKGEKPADLPIQQSTKVELFVNLKTAKALGVTVPLTLLGRADEVIE